MARHPGASLPKLQHGHQRATPVVPNQKSGIRFGVRMPGADQEPARLRGAVRPAPVVQLAEGQARPQRCRKGRPLLADLQDRRHRDAGVVDYLSWTVRSVEFAIEVFEEIDVIKGSRGLLLVFGVLKL